MIHKDGFLKGDTVEFQDRHFVWRRGTVQAVEWAEHKITGPGSVLTETVPAKVHVLFNDPFQRTTRVIILPKKRVRAIKP